MRSLEVYEDVMENACYSVPKLQNVLQRYKEKANKVEEEVRAKGIEGDTIVQSFYNRLDEAPLFSFDTNTKRIEVFLGRFHDYDSAEDDYQFSTGYLMEEYGRDQELKRTEEFAFGEEQKMIQWLEKVD